MTQARKLTPTATVDDALRDAFRHIEDLPVPDALAALVDRLTGESEVEAEPKS